MAQYRLGNTEYRLSITDHILDNGYGQIGITNVERKLERLPLFKRLHNISQLGLVNWVFPCALHNRYTHSIGVMHVIGQMALRINANMGQAFFSDAEIQILRIAGMLHDIGHYPLSHNVEQVYKDIEKNNDRNVLNDSVSNQLEYYINCPDYLNPSFDPSSGRSKGTLRGKFIGQYPGSKGFHHENIGRLLIVHNEDIFRIIKQNFVLLDDQNSDGTPCKVVNNLFYKNDHDGSVIKEYTEDDVNTITHDLLSMIGSMIVGNYSYDDTRFAWSSKYSAMIQLIHSELDADNLDYLLRDASFSGTSYGLMDMSVLMNCLTVEKITCLDPKVSDTNRTKYIVGVKAKGIGCVEQFLINKYLAYSQMTLSKYVSILEAMLSHISKYCLQGDDDYNPDKLMEMVKKPESSDKYVLFTDSFIMRKIYDIHKTSHGILSPLPNDIVSYLKNYSAFNINRDLNTSDGECICAGTKENDISESMSENQVYQKFLSLYNEIKGLTGKDLKEKGKEKELFSFRFEKYNLTKQLPLFDFDNQYGITSEVSSPDVQFQLYYYRLGNGIPVFFENKDYSIEFKYEGDFVKITEEKMPKLSVDCPQSILHELFSLQFISLREYSIDEYKYNY